MRFGWEEAAIRPEDLALGRTEYLMPDFLVAEAITMVYGAASQGKTWFMYALTKHLATLEAVEKIVYIDLDNPVRQLVDRGVDRLLLPCPKISYLVKSRLRLAPAELLAQMDQTAYGRNYEGTVLVFDSTRDFVPDTKNDAQAKRFMERMKRLREAGATVLLIHHATKSGRVIDGSVEFVRSADNVYELKQKLRSGTKLHYALKVENDRDPIKDKAFCVDTETFNLAEERDTFVSIDAMDEAFIKAALEALGSDVLNQSDWLRKMGKSRDDKTARKLIERYRGRFWDYRIDGRKKLYYAL